MAQVTDRPLHLLGFSRRWKRKSEIKGNNANALVRFLVLENVNPLYVVLLLVRFVSSCYFSPQKNAAFVFPFIMLFNCADFAVSHQVSSYSFD